MGRLTWHCCLLMSFLCVSLRVDCAHDSDQTPFDSSAHQKECSALLQFKNTTYRSSPQCLPCNESDSDLPCSETDSWMEGEDCCSWDGVTCDNNAAGSNVIELVLNYNCLEGALNLSIFLKLPHLKSLYLDDNSFTGLIPPSPSKLENLGELSLSGNMLSGQIPDIFSNLGQLYYLDLSGNNFTFPIPHSLSDELPNLRELYLGHNSLTGSIPPSLFKLEKLSDLHLSGNMLSGQIPEIFSKLEKLRQLSFLDLSGNNFSGPIPHSLCDEFPNLIFLLLSDNFLYGGVPSCLFNKPSLFVIELANNQITGPTGQFKPTTSTVSILSLSNNRINGPIPSFIFELVDLTDLDLSSNNLTGTFKFDMLPKLRRLETLDLSGNGLLSFSFDGNVNEKDISSIALRDLRLSSCNINEFPSFLGSLESLKSLDLSYNRIQGQIYENGSEGWASLTMLNLSHNFLTYVEHPWKNIRELYLDNNRLNGSLLVPPRETEYFLVSNNNLTGNIPSSFCNTSCFSALDLSNNNLGGEIPKCFESLIIGLDFLFLQNNILQGSIPDMFGNGSLLIGLDLSGNNLEGSFPRSLNSCEKLQVLNVGNNKIRDIFPYWLGTLPNLQIVVLKSNQFYGRVLDSKTNFSTLRILDLSCNKFKGNLSINLFKNMEGMMSTGEDIPGYDQDMYMGLHCDDYDCVFFERYKYSLSLTMKGKSTEFERIFKDFRAIDLSNNYFEGSIPKILGKLKSLTMLNLSHNSLTGRIPSSFGNMTALESLDLSSNKLDGRIPEQMESLTFLALLNLSHNKLSGPIPQGGQFSTYEGDSFVGNKGLCGKPLLEKCCNDLVPSTPPESLQEEDDVANEFSWKIAMIGYGCGLVIGLSIGYIVLSTGKLMWLERMIEGRLHKKARRPC